MCLSVYGEENGVDIFANFLRKEKREGKRALLKTTMRNGRKNSKDAL